MQIKIHCPECQQSYQVDVEMAGQTVHCESCGNDFLIPPLAVQAEVVPEVIQKPEPPPAEPEQKESRLDQWLALGATFCGVFMVAALMVCAYLSYAVGGGENIVQQLHGAVSALIFLVLAVIILLLALVFKLDVLAQRK